MRLCLIRLVRRVVPESKQILTHTDWLVAGTLTFGRPTVADVLLLSDRCADLLETTGNELLWKEEKQPYADLMGTGAKDDVATARVRARTMENVFFLAASAEYGSEHPLAKGTYGPAT